MEIEVSISTSTFITDTAAKPYHKLIKSNHKMIEEFVSEFSQPNFICVHH